MKSEFEQKTYRMIKSENWTEESNCYAYALRRSDIGWVNPGCVARAFGANQNIKLSDIFSAYSPPNHKEKTGEQHYLELLKKDGCTLLAGGIQDAGSDENVMFVALYKHNGRYDYHCYRHEGEGLWTSKSGIRPPETHGFHTENSIQDSARHEGLTPLGFFKVPELPQKVTPEQSQTLKETIEELNKYYLIERSQRAIAPFR